MGVKIWALTLFFLVDVCLAVLANGTQWVYTDSRLGAILRAHGLDLRYGQSGSTLSFAA